MGHEKMMNGSMACLRHPSWPLTLCVAIIGVLGGGFVSAILLPQTGNRALHEFRSSVQKEIREMHKTISNLGGDVQELKSSIAASETSMLLRMTSLQTLLTERFNNQNKEMNAMRSQVQRNSDVLFQPLRSHPPRE